MFSFPFLENEEILLCLSQMNVKSAVNKKLELNFQIFEKFIEYFSGKNFDIISLPKLSGVDCFLYPELHEDSILTLTAHRILHQLFFSAGIRNFSIKDYFVKNYKRFQEIVSGVINLARFREEILKTLKNFSEPINHTYLSNKRLNFLFIRKLAKKVMLIKVFENLMGYFCLKNSIYIKHDRIFLSNRIFNFFPKDNFSISEKIEHKNFKLSGGGKTFIIHHLFEIDYSKKIDRLKKKKTIEFKNLLTGYRVIYDFYRKFLMTKQLLLDFLVYLKNAFRIILNCGSKIIRNQIFLMAMENFSFFITKNFKKTNEKYRNFLRSENIIPGTKKKIQRKKKFSFVLTLFDFLC